MLLTLVVIGQALGAVVLEGPRASAADLPGQMPCATVEVVSPQVRTRPPGPGGPGRAVFSATQILDLEFRALVRPMPTGPHLLELKVYTPKGHLYQVLPVAFEGSGPVTRRKGPPPSWQALYRTPLPVRRAPRVRVGNDVRQRAVATLPVAGTAIVATSLYGHWTVAVHLDGAPSSCGRTASFRLVP
jgi:hypothetical protein